jgi:hypothetical protein
MLHIERLISICRLFDLNSLVQMPYYANYNQVIGIISDSKKNPFADFQLIQRDADKYLTNDKSNFIELQLANIKYDFEKASEDHKFGTINSESQYDKDNVKIANPSFLPFNYSDNTRFNIAYVVEERCKSDVELTVAQCMPLKGKPHPPKPIFSDVADNVKQPAPDVELVVTKPILPDEGVIFRKKLKKIIKKVDDVLEEKQRVKGLKQSKIINKIARKLDEFIQKSQLDKKPQVVEKVSEDEVIASKVKNITDSKPVEHLVPYQEVEQEKSNYTPMVTNSTFAKLPNPISHIQKISESSALVLYKVDDQIRGKEKNIAQIKLISEALLYDFAFLPSPIELALVIYKKSDEICAPNNKFTELIPYVHQHCPISFTSSRNISYQETTPYILSETLGIKLNEYANPVCVESEEPLVKQIALPFLTINNADINFYSNEDNDSYGDGGGDGAPPQPPGGFGIFLGSYSGKAEYDPMKKHIYTIFIANLGLNVARQPFFQKLIDALSINIYSVDDAHKILSTVSFDSIYEYYLAYQGNAVGRLIYNISGIDTFLDNSVEVENKEESIVNEDGMREIGGIDSTNQQAAGGNNVTNGFLTNISNYDISFIQDLKGGETEEAETPCCSCMPPMFDKMYNKLNHWFKGKEGNVESELEVPLLDKSGENNEMKYSNGNNSSGGIIQNIFNRFASKSDKSKNPNMSVASQKEEKKEEVLKEGSLKNTISTKNVKMKLNLKNTGDTESEVSTEANTPRDNGSKNRDDLMDAPRKEKNTSRGNDILHVSKFKKLNLKNVEAAKPNNKTFIISFTENGECVITTDSGAFTQKKNLNSQSGLYPCSIKKSEDFNEEHNQYSQGNININSYGGEDGYCQELKRCGEEGNDSSYNIEKDVC